MRIDGSCHCGLITYQAEIDPDQVKICHCIDCQSLSGSAFRVVAPAPAAQFTISGEPTIYIKTAESGSRRLQAFCPTCGSPIYATSADDQPPWYMIRVGTARQRNQLVPKAQCWYRSSQGWIADISSLPRLETQ
jgi:hypothetical protein